MSIFDNYHPWLEDSAVHVDYHLVAETGVQSFEEVGELTLEALEETLGDVILKLTWQLVIIIKFFDDQVVIVDESVLNGVLD